ncbi:MAG: PP2C family protein-serine/threonine phosphatase [Phycisphaerae bacterium]
MLERPRIQVVLDGIALPAPVCQALSRANADVALSSFVDRTDIAAAGSWDARLIVTADARDITNGRLAKLNEWFDAGPCPTLVLSTARAAERKPRTVHKTTAGMTAETTPRAIEFVHDPSKDELVGRIAAMVALHRPMQRLRGEVDDLRQQRGVLQRDLRRLRNELRQAGALQRSILPSSIPAIANADIRVLYRPAGALSGDVYDIARLDETRTLISIADATGHGTPAALLAAFVARWSGRRRAGLENTGPVASREMLRDLNRFLVEVELQDCQFVAALFAIYDEQSRTITWARGGLPYPILVKRGRPPVQIDSVGPLAGVFSAAEFEEVELQLDAGDAVIFHTDGLDLHLSDGEAVPEGTGIDCTEWFRNLGSVPIGQQLDETDRRIVDRPACQARGDDVTVIALQLEGESTRSDDPARFTTRRGGHAPLIPHWHTGKRQVARDALEPTAL